MDETQRKWKEGKTRGEQKVTAQDRGQDPREPFARTIETGASVSWVGSRTREGRISALGRDEQSGSRS